MRNIYLLIYTLVIRFFSRRASPCTSPQNSADGNLNNSYTFKTSATDLLGAVSWSVTLDSLMAKSM